MSDTVIKIENLSKLYLLGEIGTGTISHDLNRWWAKLRGKEDPFAKVGHTNDRTQKAEKGEMVWALKDINLEIKQGEILGIIGKNGAGKSTLLKILSRVTSPSTGCVKVKGRMASLLEVGTGFHPEMTGRENIYMNGTIMGMRKWEIDKKLEEIIEFAGVAKYIDTPVKRYSSGMSVRLGFAIAAHLEPEILVVDEVLAVGDAEFQKKAIGKMQDVSQGQGRTVLFVSHNLSTIRHLCNNAIILNNGGISYKGDSNSAIIKYIEAFQSIENKDYHHKEGNLDIEISKIEFLNNRKVFNVFDKIEFAISYKINNEIEEVEFFLIILNAFQEEVLSTFQRDIKEFHKIDKSNPKIRVNFENLLMPGKYYLSVGIFNKKREFVDWVENAESIEVEPFYSDGTKYDLRLGKVNMHANWENE